MLGYYLYGTAKPGGNILNQRIFMYEKRHTEFLLRENNVANYWQLKLTIYKQNRIKEKEKQK